MDYLVYPKELDDLLILSDRTAVHVRALRAGEEAPIRELFDRLSLRSRYLRFLSPLRTLPDSLLRMLACVDYRRNLALLAERHRGNAREVLALGSFGAVDADHVEVGLVVRDDWQNRRLGTALAVRIMNAAEARGYHRFIAHITAGNVPMRRLLATVGEVVAATSSGGVSEVAFVRRSAPCL
jgi:RimJ/RimL family protein N-acetyltransferase